MSSSVRSSIRSNAGYCCKSLLRSCTAHSSTAGGIETGSGTIALCTIAGVARCMLDVYPFDTQQQRLHSSSDSGIDRIRIRPRPVARQIDTSSAFCRPSRYGTEPGRYIIVQCIAFKKLSDFSYCLDTPLAYHAAFFSTQGRQQFSNLSGEISDMCLYSGRASQRLLLVARLCG